MEKILIICICLPKRRKDMTIQLESLQDEFFEVSLLDAVESLEDPRVPFAIKTMPPKNYYACLLSHQLCLQIASQRTRPTIILEDDVALHKDFKSVVLSLIENMTAWKCLRLGYIINVDESIHTNTFINVKFGEYYVGSTKKEVPWGMQSYIISPSYAAELWNAKLNVVGDGNAETFILGKNPFQLVPPIAIEDFPRFGSNLGHHNNGLYYKRLMREIKREDFYMF